MTLTISVIVPNLNSAFVAQTVRALGNQSVPQDQLEILIVGLDEPGHLQGLAGVQQIASAGAASAASNRNRGIQASHGDLLCFTDADCIPDVAWVATLARHFDATDVAVVGGGVSFAPANYWALCDTLSWFCDFLTSAPAGERRHLPTLNLAVRRAVIEQIGGMDESFPAAAGEDTEWTGRMYAAGYRLHFDPTAVVAHVAQRSTLRQLWQHGYRYGRYSPKVRRATPGAQPAETRLYRWLPRRWWLMLALAPVLALGAALAVLQRLARPFALHLLPGLWLSKLAWCAGASQALWATHGKSSP